MGAELATLLDAPAPERKAAVSSAGGTLTRRASLTALASLLDYAAKAGVSLVVTPILVSGLGRSLYGVWAMLSQLGTYMSATDGRPTEALRLIIAQHQATPDDAAKRRYVGAALVVWMLMLPLVLVVGGVFAWWLAPALTKAPPELVGSVRLTCALIVAMFLCASLGEVPESVLRGMNLGYRRMGLQASLNVLGGVLAALAVWTGLGLAGLGGAQVIRAAATGTIFLLLVRRYVPWFGALRPARSDVRAVFGMSVWLMAGDAIAKILTASDILILGAVLTPAAVTTYALTGYAASAAVGIHVFAAGAAIPGLGGLLGRGQLARAARARRELLLLSWLFATAAGTTILLWNHAFLALWVGARNDAGVWVTLLIVLGAVQTVFIRTDAWVIDATLRPRQRVLVGIAAVALTLTLSIMLTRAWGVIGLCAGILTGRAVQSIAYPVLVRASLGAPERDDGEPGDALRLLAVTALLFAGAAALGSRLTVPLWPLWAAGVITTAGVSSALALGLGPTADARAALLGRIRSMVPSRPRR